MTAQLNNTHKNHNLVKATHYSSARGAEFVEKKSNSTKTEKFLETTNSATEAVELASKQ